MFSNSKKLHAFVPRLKKLESICLMTVADIASFGPYIVKQSPKVGYALPGMYTEVFVDIPSSYLGLKSISYDLS